MNNVDIKSLLSKVPNSPGVYKFKNGDGELLYIGKAKNLKKRVNTYFQKKGSRTLRSKKMIEQIVDIEWILTESDLEAFMLETNLIKEHKPKYNILMKDDKNHVYIKITNETFPRIKIVRKIEKDGALYFGPKSSAHKCKKTLGLLQKLFQYRSCDLRMEWEDGNVSIAKKTQAFPCLDYHIKRCAGPCINKINPKDYQESIQQIIDFLEGKTEDIQARLNLEMAESVKERKFEKAAQIRDRLIAIENIMRSQIVTSPSFESMDVIAFVLNEGKAFFNLFQIRDGKLINKENFIAEARGFLSGDEDMAPEVLEAFLYDYYFKASYVPSQILLPCRILEEELFKKWLFSRWKSKVQIKIPQRGKKDKLIELARKNAESFFKQDRARWAGFKTGKDASQAIKEALQLKKTPRRIECYDISHLGGSNTVASMVVFEKGQAKKSHYRKFRLRKIKDGEIDDFKAMKEVLRRRLSYLSFSPAGIKIKTCTKKASSSLNDLLTKGGYEKAVNISEWSIALDGDLVIGALGVSFAINQRIKINTFYVHEDYRGIGIAKALLNFTLKKHKIKRAYVKALKDTVAFYINVGFKEIKIFPKCFEEDSKEDLTPMVLDVVKEKDESFHSRPDLIVIDGGKGQLTKALEARDHYGLDIAMIGIAKREEDIYLPEFCKPILLPKESEALKLFQRIRDEAHRFALSFQKRSRKSDFIKSSLDLVPGIGKKKKMKLLRYFGSVEQIKKASDKDLEKQVGASLCAAIRKHLK